MNHLPYNVMRFYYVWYLLKDLIHPPYCSHDTPHQVRVRWSVLAGYAEVEEGVYYVHHFQKIVQSNVEEVVEVR